LVCIEPALNQLDGVLAAQTLSQLVAKPCPPSSPERSETDFPRRYVNVMVANFGLEELVLPKATILGVWEGMSAGLVAAINDGQKAGYARNRRNHKPIVKIDESFKQYLKDALGHLSQDERATLEPVLLRYRHVFYDEDKNDFKGTDVIEHRIITGDAAPIRKTPYRVPCTLRDEMKHQIRDMLDKGVIREISSPWCAPAILIPKKSPDGKPKYRFCVDFRALNGITKYEAYPLPVFQETVAKLHGCKYFSTLDCFSGYIQVRIAEEDKQKTAFSTPHGHYEYNRLSFGLANGPSCFQRLMDTVLRDLTASECYVFVDDVIIFADLLQEHARRLEHVLQRFEQASSLLQPSKCVFAQSAVHYLGYTISRDGIMASSDTSRQSETTQFQRACVMSERL
jgi:hypothetical protein